jgi:lipoprotein-anchoring transpeptidase ErfK/SrfK
MPGLSRILIVACLSLRAAVGGTFAATPTVFVSVPDQKLVVVQDGLRLAQFPVSTSKFGVGDRPRSFATPLGSMVVAAKVGDQAPLGTVFKGRRPTGEVLRPNAPGRDPIVTRILHLRGLEAQNARAYSRGIYIHGTAEERLIGRPASYGCIRMRSRDVVKLYDALPVGTKVEVFNESLHRIFRETAAN